MNIPSRSMCLPGALGGNVFQSRQGWIIGLAAAVGAFIGLVVVVTLSLPG